MNTIFLGRVSSTLGLAVLSVICGGLAAQAETTSAATDPAVSPLVSQNESFTTQATPASANPLVDVARSAANEAAVAETSESTNQTLDSQLVLEPSDVFQEEKVTAVDSTAEQSELTASDNVAETEVMSDASQTATSGLVTDSATQISGTAEATTSTVAQALPDVGRTTASSPSYFGIGGNFGVAGSTAVGNQSLSLFSKIGLARFFSVRPSVLVDFDNDATFLIPVTLDIPGRSLFFIPGVQASPYIGGGLAVSTDDGIGGTIIAGLDVPVTSQITLTSGVNLGFVDDFNLGVQVGIGYNFFGF